MVSLFQSGRFGDRLVERLVELQIPMVIAGRPFQTERVSYIDVDNVNAAYNAVLHLIRLGYKRIATITGSPDSTATIDRLRGYRQALLERGRRVEDALIAEGEFTEASGFSAMQRLLPAKPDAVFAASDLMAIGGMRAVREAGLSVPEDVAFVGFDDLPMNVPPIPQLTTVRQPVYRFGVRAVEMLIDVIENGSEPKRRVIMDTELVIRDSCGAKQKMAVG